jgi:hypothetical protein
MTEISKAALARELGISAAAISRHVRNGLPVQPNGKLDRVRALRWLAGNAGGSNHWDQPDAGMLAQQLLDRE